MFSKKAREPAGRKGRGRPPGITAQGTETRERLFRAAIELFAERGYEAATMREVAERAGVSAGLLYRYFPSKRAVVLALYDSLTETNVRDAGQLRKGPWRNRVMQALRASLAVLGPHRPTLRALVGVLVGDPDEGIFSDRTVASRRRVEGMFVDAVQGATDAPQPTLAKAVGRILYFAHLAIILLWLLDRSAGQRASLSVVALLERALRPVALSLSLPAVQRFAVAVSAALGEAVMDEKEGDD